MGLIYDKLEDLTIDAGKSVSFQAIRNIESKLLSNDIALAGSKMAPQIWRNRQFADKSASGYSKGESVWLNTENIADFVNAHEDEIIDYAVCDQQLRLKFQRLSANEYRSERLELCRQVVDGYGQNPPLYYLGDITKPVQIRVSTCDDNKTFPTDDSCWKDFFIRYSDADIQLSIENEFLNHTESAFDEHLAEYHLSGKYVSSEQLENEFAKLGLDNITGKQQFTSHYWYTNTLSGFDYVKKFVQTEIGIGRHKWFRVWQSGLVEHGGIIDLDDPAPGDTYENGVYTVALDWTTPDSGSAPVYDYPINGFRQFYDDVKGYDFGDQMSGAVAFNGFKPDIRYFASVTPMNCCSIPYAVEKTKSARTCVQTGFYSNKSFGFITSTPEIKEYSYIVKGYSNQSRKF